MWIETVAETSAWHSQIPRGLDDISRNAMLNAPQQAPEFRPHKSTADSAGQSPINTFDCHISPVNCIGRHIDYPAFIRLGGVVSQPPGETYRTVQRAESPIIHR